MRARLLAEAPAFTEGAPYALHVAYLRLLRRIHIDAGQLADSYAVDERIIRLATREGDALQLALASLGRVHKRLNDNDPASAMALLENLNTEYRALHSTEFAANAEMAYGAIYNTTGQHDRALAHYLRALELVQRTPSLWSPREADLRLALARLYVNSGDPVKALDTTRAYREARAGEELPPRVEALMYFLDGRAYVTLRQLPQAHMLYRKSQATSLRLAELNAELAHRSAHDPLTGLYNRRSFVDRMRAQQAASDDCFTLLDIDHFKRINDRHGHAAGDAVLVEVGRRLNEVVRDTDMVLRWGGEEFLVYSQGVSEARRPLLVQRILNAIASTPVLLEDGTALAVTATAGAVSLPLGSSEALGWEQAIALADRALYKGKEAGRNRAFIVEGVEAAGASPGLERKLQLHLVLPDLHGHPAP